MERWIMAGEAADMKPDRGRTDRPAVSRRLFLGLAVSILAPTPALGQATSLDDLPQHVTFEPVKGSFDERMQTKITLDVRDMSVIDVIRFLAQKGRFNIVTASNVQGRATFYLQSVTIKDALDIAVLSNHLAYAVENGIIRVMTEEEYAATYGRSFSDRREVKIVRLQYAKPSYVLSALEGIKSGIGQIIIDEETGTVVLIDVPEVLDRMTSLLKEIDRPLESVVYPLQYAQADVIAEQIKGRLESGAVGTVTVDERNNQLVILALPGRKAEVERLLRQLDKPTKEVLIEARVLQIVFKPQMDYGIDWNLDFRDSPYKILRRISFNNIFLNEDNLSSSSNLLNTYAKIAVGNFDVNQFDAAIRALKQVSDTKILSNPKILVTNNEEAKIHVGDTIPYIISTTSGTGDNAITSEDVRFTDVGLKLNVTPTINDDGYVTMSLKPEISTVVGKISSQGGGIPQVNKTLVETNVMVKDGMTIVLGGLRKENKVRTRKGFPILMDIPLLGRLFSASSESIEATEIVIFITPHIVTGNEDVYQFRGTIKGSKKYDRSPVQDAAAVSMGIKD